MKETVIKDLNRHISVSEIFKNPIFSVRGFTEKNCSRGMHSQAFYEVNIVLKGESEHRIGKRTLTVRAGDTFIIPPNVKHGYAGGEGFDVYHILISTNYLEKHSADLGLIPAFSSLFRIDPVMREKTSARLYFSLTEEELFSLMPALDSLDKHSHGESAENAVIASAEALIVIARLCAIYEKKDISIVSADSEDEAFLSSVAYVYENFDSAVTVSELSHRARMSRTAYITKFKRVTGLPPAALQRQYRISVAKQLLSETELSQTEIAARVGFYDASHFVRAFRAEMGMSPLEYRKKRDEGGLK